MNSTTFPQINHTYKAMAAFLQVLFVCANSDCFRVSAGIAHNGFGLGEVAEPNIE